MNIQKPSHAFVLASLLFIAMLFGCTVAPVSSKPVVSIGSPPNGTQVPLGQEVLVQAVAVDTVGIARVELWVDGMLSAVTQPPSPQASYSGVLRWTPTIPGAHTLMAKAVNTSSVTSDSTAITVNVVTTAPTSRTVAITTPQPTAVPSASVTDATPSKGKALIHIHITTTSDWTNLRIVSGGTWVNPTNVSSSPEAVATINRNLIGLSQPITRAQAGKGVEMTLDFSSADLIPNNQVVFDIERGFIGYTQVEISTYAGGQPVLLKTFIWDKLNKDNGNILKDQILAADILTPPIATLPPPTSIPKPNDFIVIAQLNLWYFGAGCHGGFEDFVHCSGRRTTPFEPALGHTYSSSNPDVIRQQIDWAADYGVDAFSLEWTTPRGIGTSGSLEDNIDDAFLKAPNLGRIRWCIFYDTVLRMTQDPAVNADLSNGINFDDRKVYAAFVSDFDHFATKYFGQPQYLKVDARPVIYIYGAWNFHGNYAGAIQEARAKVLARGYDVFTVGDVLRADIFDRKLASQFDANTATFPFISPGLPRYSDMGQAAIGLDEFFQSWRKKIQGLKVVGRQDLVNFESAWTPQEDNRLFDSSNPIYIPALSKDQVTAMARIARANAEPVGSSRQKLIWENTWNGWAEATTIEPTANQGAKYPAGNYQFDMLEIVREVFGAETFGNSPRAP